MNRLLDHRMLCSFGAGLVAAGLLAGCPDRGISKVDPLQGKVEQKDIPLQLNRNLDLLFVVDNSGSMKEEQAGLVANFPKFIQVLQQVQGGLPDVHIGVISSNMGAGNNAINNCPAGGDQGHLQQGAGTTVTGPGTGPCAGLNSGAKFISDIADPAGGRTTNYTGQLSDVFSCMASLGTDGCGLEHHLESMRAALDPANVFNSSFIRKDAYLGIVIIGDEDDCSSSNTTVFSPSDSAKGPNINFRCTAYGITCDGDSDPLHMLQLGARTNCKSREDSQYIYPVQRYIDFVKGLKADPKSIVVADIGAPTTPVSIVTDDFPGSDNMPTWPALKPSCVSSTGNAVPTIRVQQFLGAFPDRNSFSTICNTDFSDALTNIATLIKEVIGDPCIEGNLVDTNPSTPQVEPDCIVSQVTDPNTPQETETILPECTPTGPGTHTNTPCWYLDTDNTQCASTPSHLKLITDYGGASAPLNTHIKAQCVVQ